MAHWNDRLHETYGLPVLTLPFYDETVEVFPSLEEYVGGGMAILLWTAEEGEPWSDLTVNLGCGTDRTQTIDTNNNGYCDICGFLEEIGAARRTGSAVSSGFCSYPVMEFDEGFLAAIKRA
ncbi:MAG: DUF4313 domain-containing protein [Atopobiaceae bacterium]|nr:DUF4313 domain-containing protein [Atopobiaceae bacterium]